MNHSRGVEGQSTGQNMRPENKEEEMGKSHHGWIKGKGYLVGARVLEMLILYKGTRSKNKVRH